MPYHGTPDLWKKHLEAGLREDGWPWDWTSAGTREKVSAKIICKASGTWAGEGAFVAASQLAQDLGCMLESKALVQDGSAVEKGQTVGIMSGPAWAVLAIERPLLNLIAYVSGIATETRAFVQVAASSGLKIRICPTRKLLPFYRDLALIGVEIGGGFPHRVGLSGGVLIKENHIRSYGSIATAIAEAKRRSPHGIKIEIEVTSLEELSQAVKFGAEGVLLDNFTREQVKTAVQTLSDWRGFIEVSGGIHLGNLKSFLIPRVDVISVGAITHSVKALDLSLLIDE